jgi:ATP adenylyltransferase
MQYVEKPSTGSGEGDIFVELPAQNDDRKNLILFRGKTAFVMLNAFPYASGHLLIAPYKAVAELAGLTDEELLEIQKLTVKAIGWLTQSHRPAGFNIGVNLGRAAGAGIPNHLHWHIVPRWEGDTNFMGTVGDVRVMPQSLQDAYDKLLKVVRRDV